MNKKTKEEVQALVDKATSGDKKALETLVTDVQDMIFNLSLRMLAHLPMRRMPHRISC